MKVNKRLMKLVNESYVHMQRFLQTQITKPLGCAQMNIVPLNFMVLDLQHLEFKYTFLGIFFYFFFLEMIKKSFLKKVHYSRISNGQTNFREKIQFRYSVRVKNLSENSKIQISTCYADPQWSHFSNFHGLNVFGQCLT